jgi:hypothetical protein
MVWILNHWVFDSMKQEMWRKISCADSYIQDIVSRLELPEKQLPAPWTQLFARLAVRVHASNTTNFQCLPP